MFEHAAWLLSEPLVAASSALWLVGHAGSGWALAAFLLVAAVALACTLRVRVPALAVRVGRQASAGLRHGYRPPAVSPPATGPIGPRAPGTHRRALLSVS